MAFDKQPLWKRQLCQHKAQAANKQRRGFACMDAEKQSEIAAKGGKSVDPQSRSFSRDRQLASEAGKIGGRVSSGNFAFDPERAADVGRRGGVASGLARKKCDDAEFISLWQAGIAPDEIARRTGYKNALVVRVKASKLGLTARNRRGRSRTSIPALPASAERAPASVSADVSTRTRSDVLLGRDSP